MEKNTIIGWRMFIMLITLTLAVAAPAMAENDDIAQIPNCPICGMDRQTFAHSRVLIRYADNTLFGACSIHCAALELAYHPDKIPVKIEVGDYQTRQLIDAEKATWILGGKKTGVMTRNAKWAFADVKSAEAFIKTHGGRKVDFETVLKASYADMYTDTKIIREKRKKKHQMKKDALPAGNVHAQ